MARKKAPQKKPDDVGASRPFRKSSAHARERQWLGHRTPLGLLLFC
jgi:hypothetical protein